ncbi:MAG: Crp/Fnr family transcriptional regulator [Oscillospiraceae bacterium]|nr:Crp/Fnr family transcriptional regulator [Oscillospiraceae bacterium]
MMYDKLKSMQSVALFQDINDDDYSNLINCLSPQIKHFSKNEILLLTGDSVQHIGIILDGTACAYLDHMSGSHTLISNLMPMSIFGEVLVSTKSQRSPVTIYATSDVVVAFIEYQKIYSMCAIACSAHRVFLQNMIKTISDKYFNMFDRIAILREKTLRSKIMAYLFLLSNNGASVSVKIPFSKTMLADYILANRSALSKELRKMENEGLIAVNGRNVELLFL